MKSGERRGAAPPAVRAGFGLRDSAKARRHVLVGLGLCPLTLAVFGNSFGAGLTMDSP
jgi:hypothetical protein